MKRWIRRFVLGLVGMFVLLVVAGAGYEQIGRKFAVHKFPPPGQMVDVGGRRIQLDCRGQGSPTVVFEAGIDVSGSLSWTTVHDPIARMTRACSYSRAGIMWSDPGNSDRNWQSVVDDLHAALGNAGEHPPFVLVGHSIGGPYIMIYTKYYGSDVAGAVLVDASHPDQVRRFRTVTSATNAMTLYKMAAAIAWTGAVRAVATFSDGLPHQPEAAVQTIAAYTSTSLRPMLREAEAAEHTLAEAGTFRRFGNRPLFVLTATASMPAEALAALGITTEQGQQFREIWYEMQADAASWSSRSRHEFVPETSHNIQLDRPDAVIAAVQWVVESIRAGR